MTGQDVRLPGVPPVDGDVPHRESAPRPPGETDWWRGGESLDPVDRILAGLDPDQRLAVTTTEGPVLVVAGPGSGKTRVLTHRIAYLVASGRARPSEILAVTFTNKAAREVRERLEALLGREAASLVAAGTFHSIGARILRRDGGRLGLDPSFTIYDEDDQLAIVKQALKELGLDPQRFAPRSLLNAISRAKNHLLDPAALAAQAQSYWDEVAARVYERYALHLRRAQALDFDDLLLGVVELFERHPDVLERYRARWRYLLVDEYQDTNHLQYRLVRALATAHRNLCVVGDPDQSIYSWRQADIRNILDFQRDFPDAVIIRLGRNYRSTPQIVTAADAVIRHNRQRIERPLYTDNPAGPPIRLLPCWDEQDEAEVVVGEIVQLVRQGEARYGDIAVLYRINAQSRPFEEALVRAAVPYQVVGGVRFYERAEVKDALALLRVIVNPRDWVSLRRVLERTDLGKGIGKQTLDRLERWGDLVGRSPAEALMALAEEFDVRGPDLATKTTRQLLTVWNELVRWRAALVEQPLSALFDLVIERSGLAQRYRDAGDPSERDRWENLVQLRSVLERYDAQPAYEGIQAFLEEAALVSSLDETTSGDQVTLLTLHAAKGLEFPVVFLVGVEEGLLPHARALENEAEFEEERRLFYVGITRAKHRLYLSWAATRSRFGLRERGLPSQFLAHLPDEVVEERRGSFRRGWFGGVDRSRSNSAGSPVRARSSECVEAGNRGTAGSAPSSGPAPRYRVGQRVFHATFGDGIVVGVEEQSDDQLVVVQFRRHGEKRLLARLAKLTADD